MNAPIVTLSGTSPSTTNNFADTTIDPALTVMDDEPNLEGAAVRIVRNFQGGDDLIFVNQNGISGVYNTGTGVLTMTGTASVANYQTALRSVSFETNADPPASPKTIEFTATDGDRNSQPVTVDVTVTDATP